MAEENTTPVAGSVPPQATPAAMRPATLKLKPVLRKPVPGGTAVLKPAPHLPVKPNPAPAAAAASTPLEQLKGVTQKLKGITQELPQQAILHKTGIIASQEMTEAQKQAAKARTARISLSDAIGVAPVQNEAVPMKTIRIKRPIDLPAPTKSVGSPVVPAPQAVSAAPATPAAEPAPQAASEVSVTQRKTLKISRPNLKVGSQKTVVSKRPAVAATAAAPAKPAAAKPEEEVADIPEMPAAMPMAAVSAGNTVPDVSKGVAITGIILQIAACVVMGALGYYLYNDMQLPLFCGGCM